MAVGIANRNRGKAPLPDLSVKITLPPYVWYNGSHLLSTGKPLAPQRRVPTQQDQNLYWTDLVLARGQALVFKLELALDDCVAGAVPLAVSTYFTYPNGSVYCYESLAKAYEVGFVEWRICTGDKKREKRRQGGK